MRSLQARHPVRALGQSYAGRQHRAHGTQPPVYMKLGDIAECSVEGIGTLRHPIRMWPDEMKL